MTLIPDRFRDKLIKSETADPALREKYNREIRSMLEYKLSVVRKILYAVLIIFGLAMAGLLGFLSIFRLPDYSVLIRLALGTGALFCLLWTALLVRILVRGRMDMKTQPAAFAGIAWMFIVIIVFMMILGTARMTDKLEAVNMLVNGLVIMVFAAVYLIIHRISKSELQTREKLLEIECRITEMAEKMETKLNDKSD
ncbi:hypothetical protein ACFL6I_18855 [candidate division KSB1 bacterium]